MKYLSNHMKRFTSIDYDMCLRNVVNGIAEILRIDEFEIVVKVSMKKIWMWKSYNRASSRLIL